MGYEKIIWEQDGGVGRLTLNRPETLNAWTEQFGRELRSCVEREAAEESVRAVLLTGAGRGFSSGADLKSGLQQTASDGMPDVRHELDEIYHPAIEGFRELPKPVVAAVNGPAVGLGCSLVALSDIVYIAQDAYLADPHVQVGLVAADGGPLTWPLHISLLLAKEYALTGTRISAERAVELGLANHVVADPVAEATKAAKKILELPQQAVESTKRVLNVHLERAVLATLDYALSAENQSFQTEDFRSIVTKLAAGKN